MAPSRLTTTTTEMSATTPLVYFLDYDELQLQADMCTFRLSLCRELNPPACRQRSLMLQGRVGEKSAADICVRKRPAPFIQRR